MTTDQTVYLCEEYGIEFSFDPIRRWSWRSIGDATVTFPWQGSFGTRAAAAANCWDTCGFDD